MAIKTVEEREKEFEELYKAKLEEQLNTNKSNYAIQKESVNKNYAEQTNKVGGDYQQLYDENAVQKLINEHQVAENMANLGLTDSGLNRTQQTAVQLSYANQKGRLDLQKRKSLDSLASALADSISQLDIAEASAAQSIKDNWNTSKNEYAVNMYNTDVEAETERHKAEQDQIAESNKAEQDRIAESDKAYYELLAREAEVNGYTYVRDSSGNIYRNATEDEKTSAFKAYATGGLSALEKYVDTLPSNVDLEAISNYVFSFYDYDEKNKKYVEKPLSKRTFTVIDDGGVNWFLGVDNNAVVQDEYGHEYKLSEIAKTNKDLALALSKIEKGKTYKNK